MKEIIYIIIFLFTIVSCSVTPSSKHATEPVEPVTTSNGVDTLRTMANAEEVIKKDRLLELRDTLIGKFDGVNVDTLIAEPYGEVDPYDKWWYYNWRVFTKKGSVNELKLEGKTVGIKFVREGDLDEDGKDEWGFVTNWPTSNWMRYHVFTNVNNNWKYMIRPTSIFLPDLDRLSAEKLVEKSDKKGFVKVKFSDLRNGGDFVVIDTLIGISPSDINQDG